jgi:crotonobetainyl-CoA hydratase
MASLGLPLEEALTRTYPAVGRLMKSKDSIEGPLAFSQKRKPNWKGE